ncbi:hypothetical protein ABZ260_21350 [Streptosporangium sp. NPDC006013]|uniref:hypothetical protein n=1 Tax=Streptosporangium sp. NPDC006013 TaxID=3155596 RepID=UPI0033A6BE8B
MVRCGSRSVCARVVRRGPGNDDGSGGGAPTEAEADVRTGAGDGADDLVAARQGPATGGPPGAFGLAGRLHRGTLAGFAIGFGLLGALHGASSSGVPLLGLTMPAVTLTTAPP